MSYDQTARHDSRLVRGVICILVRLWLGGLGHQKENINQQRAAAAAAAERNSVQDGEGCWQAATVTVDWVPE